MNDTMQIKIVLPGDRWAFSRALMEMHHHRKRVFVDDLGWELALPGSWLEVDQFDHEYAVYVMAVDAQGCHLGSVRLLPTTQPHMLGSVFSELCGDGSPRGHDVWEISRFIAAPGGREGMSILRIHRLLAASIVDFGLLNGISRYTLVAESRRVPTLLSVGWTVRPLSLPTICDGQLIEALEIVLDEESITRMKRRIGERAALHVASPQGLRGAA